MDISVKFCSSGWYTSKIWFSSFFHHNLCRYCEHCADKCYQVKVKVKQNCAETFVISSQAAITAQNPFFLISTQLLRERWYIQLLRMIRQDNDLWWFMMIYKTYRRAGKNLVEHSLINSEFPYANLIQWTGQGWYILQFLFSVDFYHVSVDFHHL